MFKEINYEFENREQKIILKISCIFEKETSRAYGNKKFKN